MATTFIQTLRDESLRLELGGPAVSDLAVENMDLSTPALSRAVRRSVIDRRAEPVAPRPFANRIEMHEVRLPEPTVARAA